MTTETALLVLLLIGDLFLTLLVFKLTKTKPEVSDKWTTSIKSAILTCLLTDPLFRHWQQWGIHSIKATDSKSVIAVEVQLLKPLLMSGVNGEILAKLEETLTTTYKKQVSITLKNFDVWN